MAMTHMHGAPNSHIQDIRKLKFNKAEMTDNHLLSYAIKHQGILGINGVCNNDVTYYVGSSLPTIL